MLNSSPLPRRARLVAWVVILVCVGLAPLAVTAQTDDGTSPSENSAPGLAAELGEVAPGMWIFLDPETGLITDRPSPEQLAAIRAQVSQLVNESTVGLVGKTYPDGSKSLNLQGRFQSVSVLTLNPSGEPKITCAESTKDAMGALLPNVRPIPRVDGLETE